MFVLAIAFMTTAAAPGETLLEICRDAYESFEPKAAVKSCSAAADVVELPVPQRIQALRYLAQSHILANEDGEASQAFTRMLVLDDTLLLTRDAGPRERTVFSRARATLDHKGRISSTHSVDNAGRVRVAVTDPLARVAGARLRVRADDRISVAALHGHRSDEGLVLDGTLATLAGAAEVDYEILLEGHTGELLAVDAPLRGTRKYVVTKDGQVVVAAAPAKPFDGVGYAVVASGIGMEACLLLGTPIAIEASEPEEWIPFTLVGTMVFAAVIAAGAGLLLYGPEAR